MKALLLLVAWFLLFVLCWPLAVLALVLFPLAWLISLPFRLVGITFEAVFAFLRALLFLPARILGGRSRRPVADLVGNYAQAGLPGRTTRPVG